MENVNQTDVKVNVNRVRGNIKIRTGSLFTSMMYGNDEIKNSLNTELRASAANSYNWIIKNNSTRLIVFAFLIDVFVLLNLQ